MTELDRVRGSWIYQAMGAHVQDSDAARILAEIDELEYKLYSLIMNRTIIDYIKEKATKDATGAVRAEYFVQRALNVAISEARVGAPVVVTKKYILWLEEKYSQSKSIDNTP